MTTTHNPSPSIAYKSPNCPLLDAYRQDNGAQYRPSQLTTAVAKNELVVQALWPKGRTNVDFCNPVRAEIHVPLVEEKHRRVVNFQGARVEVTSSDALVGVEKPIQLLPEMVYGFLESLDDHFHPEHKATGRLPGSSVRPDVQLDRYSFRSGIASAIEPAIDPRVQRNGAHVSEVNIDAPTTRQFATR